MGGPCDCDGQTHTELDNFYACGFTIDGQMWFSTEQFFQASKFPEADGASKAFRERIRNADPGMQSYQLGNQPPEGVKLRSDWEQVKVDIMYESNLQKYLQSPVPKQILVDSQGEITARGGLFWKTWNEILLERIREELRDLPYRNSALLASRVAMMDAYRAAAEAGDFQLIQAVTVAASKRELMAECPQETVKINGHNEETEGWMSLPFRRDPVKPEINGQPHYINSRGHVYLGTKKGKHAWCIDTELSANEVSGQAFLLVDGNFSFPKGKRSWQWFDEAVCKHVSRDLMITTE